MHCQIILNYNAGCCLCKAVRHMINDMCFRVKKDIAKEVKKTIAEKSVTELKKDITEEVIKNIEESSKTSDKKEEDEGASANEQITKELQSRLDRKNNIVFYNVTEQEGNLKADAITHDKKQIKDIADEISISITEEEITSVKRIGKKDQKISIAGEEKTVPRILVATVTEGTKAKIMKHAYKLKNSKSDYLKGIGIKHDMTRDERAKEKELREEAIAKSSEDENFVYLVRGMPWDRKIVKVKRYKEGERKGGMNAG